MLTRRDRGIGAVRADFVEHLRDVLDDLVAACRDRTGSRASRTIRSHKLDAVAGEAAVLLDDKRRHFARDDGEVLAGGGPATARILRVKRRERERERKRDDEENVRSGRSLGASGFSGTELRQARSKRGRRSNVAATLDRSAARLARATRCAHAAVR